MSLRIKPSNTMHSSTGILPEVDLLPPPKEFLKVKLPGSIHYEYLDKWQALELFEQLYIAISIKWGKPPVDN